MRSLILALVLASGFASAAEWQVGPYSMMYQSSCFNTSYGVFADTFAAYLGDDQSPKVGDVYYGELAVAVVASSCNQGGLARIEVTLPPDTEFAISGENPILCKTTDLASGTVTDGLGTFPCGQTMDPDRAQRGQYFYESIWVPYGKFIEVMFPLRSKAAHDGISSDSMLQGQIQIASDSTQWMNPHVGVLVQPNPPTITYPADAVSQLTQRSVRMTAQVTNHYANGTVYFDVGTTTDYELITESVPMTPDVDAQAFYDDQTGLHPSTTYHWRARFVDANGVETVGADQTFRTLDLPRYALTIEPSEGGTVEQTPVQDTYEEGEEVTLTAVPNEGWAFTGWEQDGEDVGDQNPLQVQLASDTVITPHFEQIPTSDPTPGPTTDPGSPSQPTNGNPATQASTDVQANSGGCSATGSSALATPLVLLLLGLGKRRRNGQARV